MIYLRFFYLYFCLTPKHEHDLVFAQATKIYYQRRKVFYCIIILSNFLSFAQYCSVNTQTRFIEIARKKHDVALLSYFIRSLPEFVFSLLQQVADKYRILFWQKR